MRTCTMRVVPVTMLAVLLLVGMSLPARSGFWSANELENIECVAEGNEAHVNATLLGAFSQVYNAVCPGDQFDWYIIPLAGDVLWGGSVTCFTNGPGLVVRLYIDTGTGLTQLIEDTPVLESEWGEDFYAFNWNLLDIATAAGHAAGPAGNYYIRVTHYSAYPGNHPYLLGLHLRPEAYNPSPYNGFATARTLAPGITQYGHLSPADVNDIYTFDIGPGQSGTGIIFGEILHSGPVMLVEFDGNSDGSGSSDGSKVLKMKGVAKVIPHTNINLYNASESLITSMMVTSGGPAYIDPSSSPLAPGKYYIEFKHTGSFPTEGEIYYKLFNHILAPSTGEWGTDTNVDKASCTPLVEGTAVTSTVYWPRDGVDFFSFHSPGYFLGDIDIEPLFNPFRTQVSLEGAGDSSYWGDWVPGKGITNKFNPLPAGDYYFVIGDLYNEVTPLDYTLTFYLHGAPLAAPVGHMTWETATAMVPMINTDGSYNPDADISIDFQPGVQDVYYATLTVPTNQYLVGFYDMYSSRPNYRLYLGQSGPSGTPTWSPALSPNAAGKLTIDMNYEYLSSPGTYFIKVQMLDTSPGRMRVLIDNYTRITECASDENNTYEQGRDMSSRIVHGVYTQDAEFCPPLDTVDWYYFNSGLFDETKGPKQHLRLRGGADGMRMELYDGSFNFLKDAEVTEVGGYAVIDLDGGTIVPEAKYYIKVLADNTEHRVQIYKLTLRKDVMLMYPMERLRGFEKLKIDPEIFQQIFGGPSLGDLTKPLL